eukprot:TRINITY_DN25_c0_g1_i10.p1 TRINITY_DN25_c0_g1~~TRINITY_DN25_c0_g1_i10.p1  ORF type:complete len:169 (+),score=58.08 TRINITY_DN25_c0_g1_i10:928-1434(+)
MKKENSPVLVVQSASTFPSHADRLPTSPNYLSLFSTSCALPRSASYTTTPPSSSSSSSSSSTTSNGQVDNSSLFTQNPDFYELCSFLMENSFAPPSPPAPSTMSSASDPSQHQHQQQQANKQPNQQCKSSSRLSQARPSPLRSRDPTPSSRSSRRSKTRRASLPISSV